MEFRSVNPCVRARCDQHVKQAVDYAANQGVDWVLLTNGSEWRVYNIIFAKPIDQELVINIDFCALNARLESDLELLYLWCKEGWVRSVLGEYHTQKQALSRFFLGAMILTEPVLDVIRKELRKVSPDVKIDSAQIRAVLESEVLKRDVMEGDKALEARRKIARVANKAIKAKAVPSSSAPAISMPVVPQPEVFAEPTIQQATPAADSVE